MQPHFLDKRDRWGNGIALWIVAGMVFLVPLSLWSLSFIRLENEVHNWIPRQHPEYQAFQWYKDHFPAEEPILFTWEGSHLDDPRTELLAEKIRGKATPDGNRRGGSKYFQRIRTPHELLAQMQKYKVPRDEAIRRLEGVLIGSGPVRIRLTEAGQARQAQVIDLLRTRAREELQIEPTVADAATDPANAVAPQSPAESSDSASSATTQEAVDGETEERPDGPPPIPPHHLIATWRGMHWQPEQVRAFEDLATKLRFPARGAATKPNEAPLVAECFQVPGSPIAVALYLADPEHADRAAAFDWLRAAAAEVGIPEEAIHMGGTAVAGHSLNQEVKKAAWNTSAPVWQLQHRSLILLSGLVGGVLAFWSLRSLKLAGLVLGVSYYTALVATSLVPVGGGSMNMVLVVMPTLLFVTTLSMAIHIANYWRHAAAVDPKTAVVSAVRTAFVPCLWAGLTGAVGQASLMSSSLTPIRDFGLYSALGTLISLAVSLYGLPALLQIVPIKAPKAEELDNAFWHSLAAWIARKHVAVMTVILVATAVCSWGLIHFRTETKVIRYFAEETRTVRDYKFIEDNLGGVIPVDVIVRFDRESQQQLKFLQRRDLVGQIEAEIEKLPDISGALSLSDFLPDEPAPGPDAGKPRQVKYAAASRVIETRIRNGEHPAARNLLATAERKTDLNAEGDELWRITAQVAILSDLDYADLRRQLDGICMSVLRGTSGNSGEKVPASGTGRQYHPGASHVVTGMVPLFLATQQELLESFIWSFSGAFASIAVMVMLVLKHPIAGILAMIPNVLPIAAVFGLVAWSGLHIDMGSTVTASIALGITIDGTLHLITWFRIGIQQGKTRAEAVAQALGHCGPAMWQTTLVVSIGLLMLYPADLVLISRFGWLMAALLGAASVTDLVLTPALLAGPLGFLIQKCTPVPDRAAREAEPDMVPAPTGSIPAKPHIDKSRAEKRSVRIRRID